VRPGIIAALTHTHDVRMAALALTSATTTRVNVSHHAIQAKIVRFGIIVVHPIHVRTVELAPVFLITTSVSVENRSLGRTVNFKDPLMMFVSKQRLC